MVKLAILGANGQVGAELCLLLRSHPDIELVPICRNRSGSAFLRWQGIACRHGRVAEATDAARLLADCDVVVNSSLAAGTPAQIRQMEDAIVSNMARFSKAQATLIHFSTQSVYGDPQPHRLVRWRSPYGRVKLQTEKRVRVAAKTHGKRAHILRLGHVCGEMQEISATIRQQIRAGEVVLPAQDCSSNTVHTVAIVQAIGQIIRGGIAAGTYDLMNTPRWSWREVYDYEAAACGVDFAPRIAAHSPRTRTPTIRRALTQAAGQLAARQSVRELFAKLFAYVPERTNARTMAWWYVRRARTEIAALSQLPRPADHLSWVANGKRFFPADTPTIDVLRSAAWAPQESPVGPWAVDLPEAAPQRSET